MKYLPSPKNKHDRYSISCNSGLLHSVEHIHRHYPIIAAIFNVISLLELISHRAHELFFILKIQTLQAFVERDDNSSLNPSHGVSILLKE